MVRFVSARLQAIPDSAGWSLHVELWSMLFGQYWDVSVHPSLALAVDTLLRLRCGDSPDGGVTYETQNGGTLTSLVSLLATPAAASREVQAAARAAPVSTAANGLDAAAAAAAAEDLRRDQQPPMVVNRLG